MSNFLGKNSSGEGEVSSCVSNLIHAFTNGLNIFKKLRERRRKRKSRKHRAQSDPASGAELRLSNSLRRGPAEIQSSYEKHYGKVGDRFARGDAIAHASLAETLIKLNTGLVGIITAFLNRDSRNSHLNLDYQSLTNLSDASRAEAIDSLNQLYRRLSQSQIQVYRIEGCPRCGSMKHQDCIGSVIRDSKALRGGRSPDMRKNNTSRPRPTGPTVARVPMKSSPSQTQLAVVRPLNTRKGSSGSSISTKSRPAAATPPYASPMGSPLPQYTPIDPLSASPPPKSKNVHPKGRRRAGSIDGPRPNTWPHIRPDNTVLPHLPPPKLPSPQKSPPPGDRYTPSPGVGPSRRRADKITPSTYTFASDSTKLGEIPQHKWTIPWDYSEAQRLNAEALVNGYPLPVESKPKTKKGFLTKLLRRGGEPS
ncbi:hypothetical protein CC78DRAFT_619790 [Lojkania enalia]|uniref:Uncharacterized protein n=1 Tax=Lojkania enalia TaxID=147567 RepID=A0A9P4K2K3_9PLEO|nr:hypothetical protein CC78DRAFT_619790 [Didymosphaeria enalia]